jgi:hypothetical protein
MGGAVRLGLRNGQGWAYLLDFEMVGVAIDGQGGAVEGWQSAVMWWQRSDGQLDGWLTGSWRVVDGGGHSDVVVKVGWAVDGQLASGWQAVEGWLTGGGRQ